MAMAMAMEGPFKWAACAQLTQIANAKRQHIRFCLQVTLDMEYKSLKYKNSMVKVISWIILCLKKGSSLVNIF